MPVTNTSVQSSFFQFRVLKMPICLIVGCSRKTGRDQGIRLYRSQLSCDESGPEVEELSIERRRRWISEKKSQSTTLFKTTTSLQYLLNFEFMLERP